MRRALGEQKNEGRGILYAAMALLAFAALILLVLGGIYLFQLNKDFYSALQGELHRGFYLSAALVVLFSSVLYTPISYGISHYFICSARKEARFGDLFFLFRQPVLLLKAVAVSVVKKGLIYLERLGILLLAALLEVVLFFSFLLVTGEDLFAVEQDPFTAAAEFMLQSPWLIGLSVALWSVVLLLFLVSYLRYILCKYVLLLYPAAGVFQAVRIGRCAIRGKLLRTMFFYLRYGAYCLLMLLSFGSIARFGRPRRHRSFSVYACGLAEEGWRDYCRRRSLR